MVLAVSLERPWGVFASPLGFLEASLEGSRNPWGVLGAPVERPKGAWNDLGPSLERPLASSGSPWSVFATPSVFKLEPQRGLQRVQESRHVLEKVTLKGQEVRLVLEKVALKVQKSRHVLEQVTSEPAEISAPHGKHVTASRQVYVSLDRLD